MNRLAIIAAWLCAAASLLAADPLQLREGDRISIIGNTLADRMQHSGWFETMIHTVYADQKVAVRNLGFSGDELTTRLRSEAFGTPDEWLKQEKTDVVFAMFGFNESFKGPAGVEQFKKDLENFLKSTQAQNYSGKGAPRIVLFSPIAQERHSDPNFPDPVENNNNIKYYVDAMREVATAHQVRFVDLFSASQEAYRSAGESLTVNGLHLRDDGYRALAGAMFNGVFGRPAPAASGEAFEKLRAAVNEKNFQFFQRYRTVDGYNVYGGRSHLTFDGIKNRDTMQREMEIRDAMAANRDKRIWAVAKGGDLEVKDDNLPEPIRVKTNKPGPNPDGTHKFLGGEEAIARMKVPPGVKVNLFASEEQFPELANPVQMGFDTKGRLWVAAWPNYPERTPDSKKGDSLLIFEDTNNDGKADKCITFIDDLNAPTGFQFYKDGVILVQAPDVWFVRDTDGDGRADWRERVMNGLDSADSHHTANALAIDPGGAIYLSDGVFHRTQVETAVGPVRNIDGAIFRFEPRTGKFETYVSYGFANPHGKVFDRWGNDLMTDATGNNTYFTPAFSGRIDFPQKHSGLNQFWDRPSRPCPGTGMLSSRHFPEDFDGNYLNCNVIGFQGIFRVKVAEEGSGLKGTTIPDHLVVSDDPNFRPASVDVAPDGSIYFIDWHNPIIGHMQHHIRDPNRDKQHGRVYRMTYEGRPLTKPVPVAGQPIQHLVGLLTAPEDGVRTRAKIELGARDSKQVLAAVEKWARQFDANKVEDQHALMESLWMHQYHNVINEPLLRQMLRSPEFRARAAAVRVLCYWRDRVSQPLALLRAAANDPAPRVRLEAVRAASFFEGQPAIEVATEILKHDTDYYLDYTFNETMRQLQKSPQNIYIPTDARAQARVLARLSDKEILGAPDIEPVFVQRLERRGMDLNTRSAALDQLASVRKSDRTAEVVAALQRLDRPGAPGTTVADLAMILASTSSSDLQKVRPTLVKLAASGAETQTRRAAYAALITADPKPEALWNGAADRATLIDSIPMLIDPSLRAEFQPLLRQAIAEPGTSAAVRRASLRALPSMGLEHAAANFTLLAGQLERGVELPTAALALLQLPREHWSKEGAAASARAVLAWAKTVPAEKRTEQEFVETVQAGMETATLLPKEDSIRVRKELLGLGVRVFVIKAVREQMRYDTSRIVVEAGKPFEIIFENPDYMPHNIVIVEPGAREEVGNQAQTMPPTPDREGRVYVPRNKKIIAASKLVEPNQKETMKLTAPKTAGAYDYVCTYPEHWKVMFGELRVVENLEEYLQASANSPVQQPKAAPHDHDH